MEATEQMPSQQQLVGLHFPGELSEGDSEVGLSSARSEVHGLKALFLRISSLAGMFSPETDHVGGPGVGLVPHATWMLFFGLWQAPTDLS